MRKRLLGGATALGVAVGLVALAVLAGAGGGDGIGDGGDRPRPLPVLGAGVAYSAEAAATTVVGRGAADGFEVEGDLPELTGAADAWRVGRDGATDRVAALAEAMGLDGSVEETDTGWSVTEGPLRLDVMREPGLPWSFSDGRAVLVEAGQESAPVEKTPPSTIAPTTSTPPPPTEPPTTIDCEMPECPPGMSCVQVCPDDGSVSSGPTTTVVEPERPADLPTAEEAEAVGRRLLTAAGADLASAEVRTDDWFTSWGVSASSALDGMPTVGMESTVSVGAGGTIEYANGWLATPERGDRYPLIGTTAALERLTVDMPVALGAPECEACPESAPLVVTDVRLGLQLVPAYGAEEAWLVPAYLFEVGDGLGYELPVFAVADTYLTEPATPPTPVPEPVPVPVETTAGLEQDAGAAPRPPAARTPARSRPTTR